MSKRINRRKFLEGMAVAAGAGALAACKPEVVKETVIVEKPVEKVVKETVVVEKAVEKTVKETVEVEKIVKETVEVEKVVTPTAAPSLTGKVELWQVGGGQYYERMRQICEGLAEDTGITIDISTVPGWNEGRQRANAAIAANAPPGLLHKVNPWDFAWREAIHPLDELYASGKVDPDGFRESVYEGILYEGRPYGLPYKGTFAYGTFYNHELFEQAGLDPETDGPKTWDELRDVAIALTDESKGQWGYCYYELGTNEDDVMLFSCLVGQAGGKILSDDGMFTLDTPEGNEAMQFMHDMMYEWKCACPVEHIMDRYALAPAGKFGMWHEGAWFWEELDLVAPDLRASMNPPPCYKTCDQTGEPECLVIPVGADDPELAAEAGALLTQVWIDLECAVLTGALPIFEVNLDRGRWATEERWIDFGEIGRNPDLRPRYWIPGYNDAAILVATELQQIWYGQKSVKEGLADAEAAGNRELERVRKEEA